MAAHGMGVALRSRVGFHVTTFVSRLAKKFKFSSKSLHHIKVDLFMTILSDTVLRRGISEVVFINCLLDSAQHIQ
jgi:hypothetical protein